MPSLWWPDSVLVVFYFSFPALFVRRSSFSLLGAVLGFVGSVYQLLLWSLFFISLAILNHVSLFTLSLPTRSKYLLGPSKVTRFKISTAVDKWLQMFRCYPFYKLSKIHNSHPCSPWRPATGEASSPQKRASNTSNNAFLHFFLLWVIFVHLDPDLE